MKRDWIRRISALGVICAMMLLLAGCAEKEQETEVLVGDETTINFRAIILGNPPANGMTELYQQLDALTIPELNCTLRFDFIPWGDERKQLNIATASGEYDFIPGGVFSDYRTLVDKNAFLDLKPYLELVPQLETHYTDVRATALEECEINGGLYGIPQFSSAGSVSDIGEGFFYREDLRKEWGLPEITDLESMEAYLYRAKEDERYKDKALITDNRIWQSLWLMITKGKYLEVNSMMETPFVVVSAKNPSVVINRLETPEFAEIISYITKWKEDGILESNMLALSDNEGERAKKLLLSDQKPCETNVPIWKITSYMQELTQTHPKWEYGFFAYKQNDTTWYSSSLESVSVISVSARTRSPETAVKLLEKIHTDGRYYILVRHGVEGIHYHLEDGMMNYRDIPADNQFGWSVAEDYLLEYDEASINVQWDEVNTRIGQWQDDVAQRAKAYPLDGFNFNSSSMDMVLQKLETARLQYFQPLVCGYTGTTKEGITDTSQMIRQAGLDSYIEAMQEQLTVWMQNKK